VWYEALRVSIGIGACLAFRIRSFGRQHLPREGGALLASNHQSHLDPPLIGQAVPGRINYLARRTLFKFFLFRWLIQSLDAIPIDRDGSGLGGIKETMRRLRGGQRVLMFPEGTRTKNGDLQPLKPGFCAMVRRSNVPIVPLAIDGSFQAWPRTRMFPRCAVIHIHFGRPILPGEQAALTDEQLVELVRERIAACLAKARASRARAG
jgi:1-acyl-sn-glycerol-3-phosphate acyltransferase